ncbi:hypothetical protein ACC771_19850, partial [Rhizobium ruizarguesonis]
MYATHGGHYKNPVNCAASFVFNYAYGSGGHTSYSFTLNAPLTLPCCLTGTAPDELREQQAYCRNYD